MSKTRTLLAILAEALLLQSAFSLRIGKSSPCYDQCDGAVVTGTEHLSCIDAQYDETSGTSAGRQARECLLCTEKSTYSNATDSASDQYWFMFHIKYTQQYCLFDGAANEIDACATQCAPLESVLTTLWANTSPPRPLYDYCDATSGVYPNYAPDCAACLRAREGTVILGNFMETMYSACATKPNITDGNFIDVKPNGDLFDIKAESVTTESAPTATDSDADVPSSAATQTGSNENEPSTSPSANPNGANTSSDSANVDSNSSSSSSDDGGLSTGATAGIAVGATAIGLGALAGLGFFFWRRRRATRSAGTGGAYVDDKGPTAGLMGGQSPASTAQGYHGQEGQSAYGEQGYAMEKTKHGYGGPGAYAAQGAGYGSHGGYGSPAVEMSGQSVVSEMPAHGQAPVELPGDGRR